MNLLGCKLYDPAVAVSKATTTATNLIAVDTGNLRITATVPSHGYLRARLGVAVTGAVDTPQILLGVLLGTSNVLGRVTPQYYPGTLAAIKNDQAVGDFVAFTTFTGAQTFDAAYAIQVPVAASAMKYGGPNTTGTGTNAWGGFQFELWDARPVPLATPGKVTGLFIAGTNVDTTFNQLGNIVGTLGTVGFVSNGTCVGGTVGIVAGGTIGAVTGSVNSVTSAVTVSGGTIGIVQGGTIGAVTGSVNSVTNAVTVSGGTVGIVQGGTIGNVTSGTIGAVTGSVASVTNAVTVSGGTIGIVAGGTIAAVTGNVGNVTGTVGTVGNLTNLPAMPASWVTSTGIAAAALNGKGDWLGNAADFTAAMKTSLGTSTVAGVTILGTLPAIPNSWITSAGIVNGAFNGKGDWVVSSAFPANFSAMAIAANGIVFSNVQYVNGVLVNGVGSPANPWGP